VLNCVDIGEQDTYIQQRPVPPPAGGTHRSPKERQEDGHCELQVVGSQIRVVHFDDPELFLCNQPVRSLLPQLHQCTPALSLYWCDGEQYLEQHDWHAGTCTQLNTD